MKLTSLMLGVVLGLVSQSVPTNARPGPPAVPQSTGVLRLERHFSFDPPWEAKCEAHEGIVTCGVPILFVVSAETPPTASKVDIVVEASLDYRNSSSDAVGLVSAVLEPEGGSKLTMNPGRYPILSPSPEALTSTTLMWMRGAREGGGLTYDVSVSVAVTPPPGPEGVTTVSGTKLAVVIEMWTTGP